MPVDDDDDDLFNQEFDFVDDDDEDQPVEQSEQQEDGPDEESAKKPKRRGRRGGKRAAKSSDDDGSVTEQIEGEGVETPAEPEGPPKDHVVHIYEAGEFKRTIAREFSSEEAEAFVTEYNRTSTAHSREAVAANREEAPAPTR